MEAKACRHDINNININIKQKYTNMDNIKYEF